MTYKANTRNLILILILLSAKALYAADAKIHVTATILEPLVITSNFDSQFNLLSINTNQMATYSISVDKSAIEPLSDVLFDGMNPFLQGAIHTDSNVEFPSITLNYN